MPNPDGTWTNEEHTAYMQQQGWTPEQQADYMAQLEQTQAELLSANSSRSGKVIADPGQMVHWGGGDYMQMPDYFSGMAQSRMTHADDMSRYAGQEAMTERGAQAWENQELSDRESMARGWDQEGAIQLAREAAMGQSPSEAAYMMQQGLDQGMAGQTSMAGSARGAGAIALAQSNAAANVANMQGQAYTEAGRLRAQEMAQARGLYGGLAGQMREQDQNRLGMSNQMSQYNAGLNDQYRLGMMGSSAQFSQAGQGWYQGAMQPYNQQAAADLDYQNRYAGAFQGAQELARGIDVRNEDRKDEWRDRILNASGTAVTAGASTI